MWSSDLVFELLVQLNYSVGTPVSVLKKLLNLAHLDALNFYHNLIEVIRLFLVIANLRPHLKGIPIALRIAQVISTNQYACMYSDLSFTIKF